MAIKLNETQLRLLKVVGTEGTTKVYPNNITSYGGLVIEGYQKGGYDGIHLGPSANYMTVMSGDVHQGLYNQTNGRWIIYFNRSSDSIGLGTNSLVSNNIVTINGNASIKNLLTVASGTSHYGIKVGDTYINAINGDIIFQNNNSLRFGSDSWNWDEWAGLKYDCTNKYIYLGIADKNIFNGNNALSGGRILTPGISHFHVGNQTTYYMTSDGDIKASSVTVDNNNSSGSIQLVEDGEGGTIRLYSKSNTYCYEIDAHNDETIRIHTAHKNPNGTNKFISWNGKSGNVSADGTFYVQNAYPVMPMKSANGYYGMTLPDVSDTNWIRTTDYGIIPYASGGSSALGTETWPFNKIYGKQIYGTLNGNASTATLLALHNTITSSTTRSIAASSWNGSISGVTYMWGQSFKDSAIGSDTGDLVLAIRAGQYTSGGTELCVAIDGDFYSMGNKVLHAGNYSSYALSLNGGTMAGTAFIRWPDTGNWDNSNSGVTFPVTRGGLEWRGQSDYIKLFAEETASDQLNLICQFGDDANPALVFRNNSGTQVAKIGADGVITATTFSGNASSATYAGYLTSSITFTPAESALTPANVKSLIGSGSQIRKGSWSYAGNGYIPSGSTATTQCPFGAIDLAGTTVIQSTTGTEYTQIYITPPTANTSGAIRGEMLYYIDQGTSYSPTWYRVLTDKNYSSYALPLSGGTMSSGATIKFSATAGSIATSDPMSITYGRIAAYGPLYINADTDGSTTEYLVLTAGRGHSSSNNDGLAVGYSTLTWQGATVMTSSNYSSWAAPASHSHAYLPLTGGTLTGRLAISYAHTGGGMLQLMSTSSNEASIDYAAGGTTYWVVGKGCGGTGNGTFAWWYNPGGGNVMTLTSAGVLSTAIVGASTRIYTGYDSGVTNSISCSNWFRSSGATGWYNATYDGGWYMSDTTWVRTHNSKGVYTGSGQIRSDRVDGGMWISGTHQATFVAGTATTAAAGNFYQGWYSGKTKSGAWSIGALAGYEDLYFVYGTTDNYNGGNNAVAKVQFGSGGQVYGAVWNDYAEYRTTAMKMEPGRVVVENNDDTLSLSTERLMPGANIVSDTFGFAIGETENAKTPLAVSGRVLAYPNEPRDSYHAGDAVCSGPNGTVSKMTREEIITYPERIIGTVSAVPDYETWGQNNVSVNGRIWIKV